MNGDYTAAYRSILAQLLFRHRHEQNMIDKFSFAMNHVSHGQLKATSLELIDLLQFCFNYACCTIKMLV